MNYDPTFSDEPEPRVENGFVEPAAYQRSPYRRSGSEPSVQPMISHPQASQSRRQSSFENKRVPSDVLQSLSTDYQSNATRRYSASSESDSSSMYQTSNGPSPRKLSDTSPRQLSQDVDEERDVDVPYVIGQFKLENKLYRKPFFLDRASTFSVNSKGRLPKKSNLKRAVSTSRHSLKSHSSHSVIYEEIPL